jgi:hypothetical protein
MKKVLKELYVLRQAQWQEVIMKVINQMHLMIDNNHKLREKSSIKLKVLMMKNIKLQRYKSKLKPNQSCKAWVDKEKAPKLQETNKSAKKAIECSNKKTRA